MSFNGVIAEDIREATPDWSPYRHAEAPADAPNVLYLLWDDTGIATWDCFGGLVEMPAMKRIADRGVRLTQFHTTALCSPTRAALLTGRNATSVGVASVLNMAEGFPGHNGRIPADAALVSEVLSERGWSTYAVGKWHLAPIEDCHAAGPRRYWPLGRGFDRFYGFLDGMTDQWYPSLVSDNHPIDPPATPEQGYHLSKDIADNAIRFLRDHRAAAPDKPWFMYLCPGAGHSPHQVAAEWADRYRGRFDMGYERYRDIALANQKALGLIPADTELSPMNPYADCSSPDGVPWPEGDTVRAWDSLSDDEKRISCRMAEVFAGFLTYTDAQIGRVLDHLEATGQLDNTIVVVMSDNGASGEGGPNGALEEFVPLQGGGHTTAAALEILDEFGGPATAMNYSTGWAMAFNTPYKLFKRYASHEGGIADPCIVSWPAGLPATGTVADHYAHVCDVTPTVYDLLGIDDTRVVDGVAQRPLEGTSFAAALRDPNAETAKRSQFYSMMGTRGIWQDGWFANTVHPPTAGAPRGWSRFDADRWELFHIESDRSQLRDLSADHPDKLDELKTLWHEQAQQYNAFPLNDLSILELIGRGGLADAGPEQVVFYPNTPATHTPMSGLIRGRSFTLQAVVSIDRADAEGIVFTQGKRSAGHALYLVDGRLRYVCTVGGKEQKIVAEEPISLGDHVFEVRFTSEQAAGFEVSGGAELVVDGRVAGTYSGLRLAALDMMQSVSAGRGVAYSVSADFVTPFALAGAVLHEVRISFDGQGLRSPDGERDAAFAND